MDDIEKINSYVCETSSKKIEEMKEYLSGKDWQFEVCPPYACWKAHKDKINIVAYLSGKITVQGKGTGELVAFFLEPDILKEAKIGYENILRAEASAENFLPHAGIDESGKGDFFGPLVIAAVYVDDNTREKLYSIGVKDSKMIKSEKKMKFLAEEIRKLSPNKYSVVSIGPEAYNRMYSKIGNLNKLLAWGHSRSLENILEKVPTCNWAIADKFGNERLIVNALLEKGKKIKLKQMVRAEEDIAVAAASILARDEFVRRLDSLGKGFGIVLPKGASQAVNETAGEFVSKFGLEKLPSIAKMHFKTALRFTSPELAVF